MSGSGKLHKALGIAFGLAVLIGSTVGAGILRTAGEVAAQLPSVGWFLGAWVIGGVYALLGAMSLAEPGAMIARSGGQYTIVHRALGAYPGFIVGWSDWLSTSASIGFISLVFGEYLLPLVPGVPGGKATIACTVVIAFALLQWSGIRSGDLSQQLLSALKALAFGGLAAACLVLPVPSQSAVAPAVLPAGTAFIGALVVALQSVIYTYDGWNGPLYFGEETVDAGQTVPRSMIVGVLLVLLIYAALNAAFLRVIGIGALAGDPFAAATAGHLIFGVKGDLIIRLVVLVALLGSVSANLLMASRVPISMARDRLMPAVFDTVNAGGTPTVSHWSTVGVTLGFILTGTVNSVLALAAFFFVATYMVSFTAIFVLRRTEPDTPRPFRVPGFPYTTGLVLVGSVAFLAGAVLTDRVNSVRALLLLAASYPAYRAMLRYLPRPSE